MSSKTKTLAAFAALIILIGGFWYFRGSSSNQSDTPKNEVAGFNKTAHSIDDPSSIWVVVNKQRPLPATYTPSALRTPSVTTRLGASSPEMKLRDDAAEATEELVTAAKSAGINLMLVSAYRSYDSQKTVYNSYVAQDGQANADTYSARPGHSEHQTGLAADFGTTDRKCELDVCFGDTNAGKWLADNAPKYGFILRYARGNEQKVGYEYEPWHFRYVGKELAAETTQANQTLEEFFGLSNAPTY